MKITNEIKENRRLFLEALRSGDYEKGAYVAGQDEPPSGATGFCAIGLPYTLFLKNSGPVQALTKVLGITKSDIYRIQNEWNDSPLTFPEIAERIEIEIFSRRLTG